MDGFSQTWPEFAGDVLSMGDISVEESEDLPRILDPIANESAATFIAPIDASESGTPDFEGQALVHALETRTPALLKLKVWRRYLCRLKRPLEGALR